MKDHLSDSVARKHRLALGVVDETVSSWLVAVDASTLPMPEKWLRDLRRRIARRLRDVGR